jgi:hypothetical protein
MMLNGRHYTNSPFNYLLQHITLIWSIFLLLTMAWGLWNLRGEWPHAQGWEQERIAGSIADGHGFSFEAKHRWLFEPEDSGEYFPTAWAEPIYPALMAIFFRGMGDYAKLGMLVFQVIALLLTSVVLYHLGRIVLNRWTGILAGSVLAMFPAAQYTAHAFLGNATIAGLMVSFSACSIIWCLEKLSVPRGLSFG